MLEIFDEEESKRLRIFQRQKRQELQLIIERCNEVDFKYVCLPNVRSDDDLSFEVKNQGGFTFLPKINLSILISENISKRIFLSLQ